MFDDAPKVFTREMKLAAVVREIGYRRRVYARRIADGKMSKEKADFEIEVFEAIAKDYGLPTA